MAYANFILGKPKTFRDIEATFNLLQMDLNHVMNNLSHENVKRIFTEYCEVQSEDGLTRINGRLFQQYDNSSTLRLHMGYNSVSGLYEFNLYSSNSDLNITLNSSGEAVFAGNIATLKNAYVGNNLYIGSATAFANKGVFFYSTSGATTDDIGMFLNEYAPGDYELLLNNPDNRVNIISNYESVIGSLGDVYLVLQSSDKYFTLANQGNDDLTPSQIIHSGQADLIIKHEGSISTDSGNIVFEQNSVNPLVSITTGAVDKTLVLDGGNVYLGSTDATSIAANKGWTTENFADLSTTVTKSYVDDFGKSLTWDGGTRTLTLKDNDGNTLSAVVISS